MLKKDVAFLTKCYFVKYLISTSLRPESWKELKEPDELAKLTVGLT